jgi:hypothetical protein
MTDKEKVLKAYDILSKMYDEKIVKNQIETLIYTLLDNGLIVLEQANEIYAEIYPELY